MKDQPEQNDEPPQDGQMFDRTTLIIIVVMIVAAIAIGFV